MTDKKRPRGRPKTGARFPVQKHLFLDLATAEMLKQLAQGNESAYLRELIQREYKKSR